MTDREAIERARKELAMAVYISECGSNEGIRAMYSDRAEWICALLRLAEMVGERE
jgi:hypothetical protein